MPLSPFRLFTCFMLLSLCGVAQAQWVRDGHTADRYSKWKAMIDRKHPLAPDRAVGASSLAFDDDGTMYTCCEKHAIVLKFPPDGGEPSELYLKGMREEGTFPDVDIEAISIHNRTLYLMDEDLRNKQTTLELYEVDLDHPSQVKTIPIEYAGIPSIDSRTTDGSDPQKGDLKSIEGLVVSENFYGRAADKDKIGKGPYFHLLDEEDVSAGHHEAKLYVGVVRNGKLVLSVPPVSFKLKTDCRMPELFLFENNLYALMTKFGDYHVVRLDANGGEVHEVISFSSTAAKLKQEKFDTNFEGAAVHPKTKDLWMTADNEKFVDASGTQTPPNKENSRGITPLIVFPFAKK